MILLAADTAVHLCSACLYDSVEKEVRGRRVEDIGRGHAERLLPVIEETLAEAGRALADLDRLAVSTGPGSFTGIRVGVAAMRGLALALDIPLIGITVFDCMAHMADAEGAVLVVLDARRDEVYAQLFSADRAAVGPPQVLPRGEALGLALQHDAALFGSAAPLVAELGADTSPAVAGAPSAVDIAVLAALAADRDPADEKPVPLYLRAPDAKPQDGFALPRREAS